MASWKKTASILLIVMIILVTGCVKKNNIESPATESATNEVEVSVSTQKVSSKSTPSLAPTESIKSENPTQEPSSVVSTATATPSATQAVFTSNLTLVPSVSPTQTAAPTAKPTVKPTVAPKTTAPTVKPTQKPTPTPTAKPTLTPYDDAKAQYWVDFAKDYALSIGLELVSDCTGCWDTPEVVYAKRTQSKIQENLTNRLERYKRVGNDSVCIWYEKYNSEYAPTADAYQIYIAYGY